MSEDTRDLAAFGYKQVARPDARQLFVVCGGVFLHLGPDGHLPDFLSGIWRGGAGLLLDLASRFSRPGTVALCFAELAARYPLSGGVYQWSGRLELARIGWMAGWVYLCGSVISLAAVALALQATLPQIAPAFQFIGQSTDRSDRGRERRFAGLSADRGLDPDQLDRGAASRPDQQYRRDRRALRRGPA